MKLYSDKLINYKGWDCVIAEGSYRNGRKYMILQESETGQPIARITLNLEEVPIMDDMIIVKDYAENEGIYKALLAADIIEECERKVSIGFNYGLICFLKPI